MSRSARLGAFYGCVFLGLTAVTGAAYEHVSYMKNKRDEINGRLHTLIENLDGQPGVSDEDWKIAVRKLYESKADSVNHNNLRLAELRELESIILKD